MQEPQCFVCNNCPLICTIYEAALKRGLEADWEELGDGLCVVEVSYISRNDFEDLVSEVRVALAATQAGQHKLDLAA
ncbi:MAG: hypothetical protein JO316_25610 [Abitibacteriaceae bacterium]|nr:hypothetical protein [Abditibacteriaceae bacterium]MBV9868749.1 hypothetical protein [Abditibacteriaceae bacterium]